MSIIKRSGNKKIGTDTLFPNGKRVSVPIFSIFFALAIVALTLAGGRLFLNSVYVPVILMYHSVGEEDTVPGGYGEKLNVSPRVFARQMQFLKDRGYKVIPLYDFVEKIARNERIPPKTVTITFDDGLRNNFLLAYPELKKHGFPATIFVTSDFIGKEYFLNTRDMEIMQKNNISIGSHTASHNWLPDMDHAALARELSGSKEILEEKTGREIRLLSYPLGGFDGRVKKAARDAGYIGAVATNPGKNYPYSDLYALKRIRISMTSDNLLVFWLEISGYYTFIKEMRDD